MRTCKEEKLVWDLTSDLFLTGCPREMKPSPNETEERTKTQQSALVDSKQGSAYAERSPKRKPRNQRPTNLVPKKVTKNFIKNTTDHKPLPTPCSPSLRSGSHNSAEWVVLEDGSLQKEISPRCKVRIWFWKEHFMWERTRLCSDTGVFVQISNGFEKTIEKAQVVCLTSKDRGLKAQILSRKP